jgi:GH35 family endo-1,4-beta-xylanase
VYDSIIEPACSKEKSKASLIPKPGDFNWTKADAWLKWAKQHNFLLRVHGPIGPQSSKWVMEDSRTAGELEPLLRKYMAELVKRYDRHPEVKLFDPKKRS